MRTLFTFDDAFCRICVIQLRMSARLLQINVTSRTSSTFSPQPLHCNQCGNTYSGKNGRLLRHTPVESPSRHDNKLQREIQTIHRDVITDPSFPFSPTDSTIATRTGCDRTKSLLSRSIPNLELYPLAIHFNGLDFKVDPTAQR